jgi:hypothetical protein
VMRKLSSLARQCKQETKQSEIGYAKLLTIAKGELAAEALYYDAYFKTKMESLRLQMFKNWQLFRLPIFWCQRFNSNGQEFLRIERQFSSN